MRFIAILTFLIGALVFQPVTARAADTNIMITVLAQDAKFIGSGMGGALVTVKDSRTGDLLASGLTSGETGDTGLIMTESRPRDAVLVTEDSAKLQFSLSLFEPTPVTVTATGPLASRQNTVSVSQDMVLIPGKDYSTGNGIMLEMPGFAVDIIVPPAHEKTAYNKEDPMRVVANITKMCGCHIAPDSPWPPARYEVEIHIYKDDIFVGTYPMKYAENPGRFGTDIIIPRPGTYKMIVTAFDKETKESGMDMTTAVFTE